MWIFKKRPNHYTAIRQSPLEKFEHILNIYGFVPCLTPAVFFSALAKFGFSDIQQVQVNIFLAKKQRVTSVAFVYKLTQTYTEKQQEKIHGKILGMLR